LFYVIIPPLFLYFLPFCYPYILLHFKCFLLLVILPSYSRRAWAASSGSCAPGYSNIIPCRLSL